MVGWHHQLDAHEFEQALGDGEGQESLACCGSQGCEQPDTTQGLKNRLLRQLQICFIKKTQLAGFGD